MPRELDFRQELCADINGFSLHAAVRYCADECRALGRYRSDGSLDTSFGTVGKVVTDFGAGVSQVNAMAIQTDGKIVAVGITSNNAALAALARYMP